MVRPVYLDFHATTPVDPRVLETMLPFFIEHFGNPASRQHPYGWEAQKAVDAARGQVAALIGASAAEIVFTSGATESNNLAIKGAAHALRERGDHIITVATEHKSVLDSCRRLEREGCRVTRLGEALSISTSCAPPFPSARSSSP
jgi:cysteine desulfurase